MQSFNFTLEEDGAKLMHGNHIDDSGGICRPYLLVIHIPVYVDAKGTRWTDALWHKDLVRHLDYLENFILACPHIYADPPVGFKSLNGYPIQYVSLARQGGRVRNTLTAPKNAMVLWSAIGKVDVIHSSVGGCNPLTLPNLTFFISSLRRKYRLVIVESSTWRILPKSGASILKRWRGMLSEWVNRVCVSTADLSVFTQAEYKQSLLSWNKHRGHVIHASWIDGENVQTEASVLQEWERKQKSGVVRYLFAGRLDVSKGVDVLLKSIQLLDRNGGASLYIDLIGEGPLEFACSEIAAGVQNQLVRVRILPTVEYGEPFFKLLRDYSAVIVPSVGDEQPRIVYDAYSQGIPVLASATPGLIDCVEDGRTGHLFDPGNVEALAEALRWGAEHQDMLTGFGLNGLEVARALTHGEMHRRRFLILDQSIRQHFG